MLNAKFRILALSTWCRASGIMAADSPSGVVVPVRRLTPPCRPDSGQPGVRYPRAPGSCAVHPLRCTRGRLSWLMGYWQVSVEMYLRCTSGGVADRRRDPPTAGSAVPSQYVLTVWAACSGRTESVIPLEQPVLILWSPAGR